MGKTKKMFHKKYRGLIITKLMARDGHDCCLCRELLSRHVKESQNDWYITFDHIIPRSFGGTDKLNNLQLAHQCCNIARGSDPILPEDEEINGTGAVTTRNNKLERACSDEEQPVILERILEET